MRIWIDADACPRAVKELVFRTSARLEVPVCLVANRPLTAPPSPLISVVQVRAGSDVADSYIVQHVAAGDLVITADIPLASLAVARGATALDPHGDAHTADTIGERLAVRNLMEELRWARVATGGPAAYSAPTGSASPRLWTGCSRAVGRPRRDAGRHGYGRRRAHSQRHLRGDQSFRSSRPGMTRSQGDLSPQRLCLPMFGWDDGVVCADAEWQRVVVIGRREGQCDPP